MKTMIKVSLLPLFALIVFNSSVNAAWDTPPLDQKYYPNTVWEQRFSAQPDVLATASIDDAIYSCDDVVGPRGYCVVQITDTASRQPLFIDRSRTKIIGFEGMRPLRAQRFESTLSIVENTKHVVIEGLELQGRSTGWDDVYGILVNGENINGVVIRDNHIHHYKSDDQAHAIAVYGSGATGRSAIRNVLLENNRVHDMETGASESIVVNGNVVRWAIVGNTVKDVNNIAIDAIGGEGTSPTRTLSNGRVLPGARDRARLGFILNNHVENMSARDNVAYADDDEEDPWAAAIYVDGGSRIKIEGNTVINAPWAYEIGAENCVVTSHISLLNNSASGSLFGDLLLGGYAETGYNRDASIHCDPLNPPEPVELETSVDPGDATEGHGYVARLRVQGNDFDSVETLANNILPQYRLRGAVILQEGVDAANTHRNGGAPGDQNAILKQEP